MKKESRYVAESVERREERDGSKRVVVSAFVNAKKVEEAKEAMRRAAEPFAAKRKARAR